MQTYTKHIPKLTHVYITYANIYQKLTYAYTNICKDEATKHIPKLTYVYITYANIYQN